MLEGTETDACRICPVRAHDSDFGKTVDRRYTASTKSMPRCHTCNSRKWLTYDMNGPSRESLVPSPQSLPRMLRHIHEDAKRSQSAQQGTATRTDHRQGD